MEVKFQVKTFKELGKRGDGFVIRADKRFGRDGEIKEYMVTKFYIGKHQVEHSLRRVLKHLEKLIND